MVKDVNGRHEPVPPGLFIPIGNPVAFTYAVTNTGNITLNPVTLTDNRLGAITCPETVLDPGDSETCTAAGPGGALVGAQTNLATATGQGVDNTGRPVGPPVTATDTANYLGEAPAISLAKQVNGHRQPTPPGPYVAVGDPVTFSYLVSNTGNVTLDPVTLTDNVLGAIVCPSTSLAPGDSETCTATAAAVLGQQANVGTATGQGVDDTGTPIGPPVNATDTANYFGAGPDMTLVKDVNGQHEPTSPGPLIPVGDPVTFTYLVTNTGNVTLNPVTVNDSILGAVSCPAAPLAPGGAATCSATAPAIAGQQTNVGTATGQGVDNNGAPVGQAVTADDTGNYIGTLRAPAITLAKQVNGQSEPTAPGLYVPVASPVTFSYLVTNNGDYHLEPGDAQRQRPRLHHLPTNVPGSRHHHDLQRVWRRRHRGRTQQRGDGHRPAREQRRPTGRLAAHRYRYGQLLRGRPGPDRGQAGQRPARADRPGPVRAGRGPGDLHLCDHQHRQRDPQPGHGHRQQAQPGRLSDGQPRPRRIGDLHRHRAGRGGPTDQHWVGHRPRGEQQRRPGRHAGDRHRHGELLRRRPGHHLHQERQRPA